MAGEIVSPMGRIPKSDVEGVVVNQCTGVVVVLGVFVQNGTRVWLGADDGMLVVV